MIQTQKIVKLASENRGARTYGIASGGAWPLSSGAGWLGNVLVSGEHPAETLEVKILKYAMLCIPLPNLHEPGTVKGIGRGLQDCGGSCGRAICL